MGWVHPDISLEEMVKLTKGFVDILILASGYQSSGRIAHWDAQNIKKVFHWGLFFENVFSRLSGSDAYQDSVEELDAALSEMTSDASFPQVVDSVLFIEMELDELLETEHDCLNAYLKKLTLQNRSLISVPDKKDFLKDSVISSQEMAPIKKNEKSIADDLTKYALQEILKRKCAVSCISAVETGLDIILNTIRHKSESDNKLLNEQLKHEKAPMNVEPLLEFITWNHWKSRNLSYFLDKRTVRLVSGASLIFSAPKVQWIQVFQGLNISAKSSDNDFSETIELLLLGCIASRWNCLIEHFMHVSYYSLTISEQYHELCNLVFGRSQSLNSTDETMISKESSIIEYLTGVLGGQLHQLWKLSPALAAAAIPSWSPFLRLYLSEIETQFKGKFSMTRCCNCSKDTEEHKDCELAERIWCLYIFHLARLLAQNVHMEMR
ncbi:hypothetical protein CMV_008584 [Castanea mollissima]|uniref:Uncharacterized protein n=1 Tax=Castanea mollissima TaxID=60419 RepID=A0A8J4R8A8_9ROSI|nr:hypothetical protein CMV_008584 [Castanea mollissima]